MRMCVAHSVDTARPHHQLDEFVSIPFNHYFLASLHVSVVIHFSMSAVHCHLHHRRHWQHRYYI